MKRTLRNLIGSLSVILAVFILFAFVVPQDQKVSGAWAVPAKYKSMKNNQKGDAATGKMLYAKHCKSCHGGTGLGDGPKQAASKRRSTH